MDDEAKVRRKLVESDDVDLMIAIRSNFFYTRTVPCEPWFLNRANPEEQRDKVLMIDARNVYRKVTRKIYDFSPEQQQKLLAIVWLYRGRTEHYEAPAEPRIDIDGRATLPRSRNAGGKAARREPRPPNVRLRHDAIS